MDLRATKWSGFFTQTKVSSQGRLELALETKKKERLTIGYFSNIWF
jgi:hypothetical protein